MNSTLAKSSKVLPIVHTLFLCFRLCLVAVKRFSENTYFPEMLISGKGKYFSVFGCISKNFLVFGKEKGKHKPKKNTINERDLRSRSRDQRRELATARDRDRSEIATSRRRDLAPSIAI